MTGISTQLAAARAVCLFTILIAGAVPTHAEAVGTSADRTRVAVLPIKLLDTSAEPNDQRADHERRLAAMTNSVSKDLASSNGYETVQVSQDLIGTRCPDSQAECLLEAARAEGAQFVFIGVVHKSSTLIMQMWARLVDAKTGRDVFARDLNFRGDNDEAWLRAEAFLAAQMKELALPR